MAVSKCQNEGPHLKLNSKLAAKGFFYSSFLIFGFFFSFFTFRVRSTERMLEQTIGEETVGYT